MIIKKSLYGHGAFMLHYTSLQVSYVRVSFLDIFLLFLPQHIENQSLKALGIGLFRYVVRDGRTFCILSRPAAPQEF